MDALLSYTDDLISEIILQVELDGHSEVKQYASYWLKDIYHFCSDLMIDVHTQADLSHTYNPLGYVELEKYADVIYHVLRQEKLFCYFFDAHYKHMRELVKSLGETPISFIDEPGNDYSACTSLYRIDEVLPISLSSYDVSAYLEDRFIPEYMDYEGLRRAGNEVGKLMPIALAGVNQKSFKGALKSVLKGFDIPLDKHVEAITISDSEIVMCLSFNGVDHAYQTKQLVFSRIYDYSSSGIGLIALLERFFKDAVAELIGTPKEKGSDLEAQYGHLAMKDMPYHGLKQSLPVHLMDKELKLAELQSLYTIKQSLLLPGKPVVSTSFGADSVLMHWLISKVYPTIDVYHGKTGLDFPEIYTVEKAFKKLGLIKDGHYFVGKNETSYWELVEQYGFNFDRKGDRRKSANGKTVNMSELCCNVLKHAPFKKVSSEQQWTINFAGLRADESRARELAIKRDGPLYYASSWEQTRVNPIVHWTNEQVWEYIRKNDIPYASIYDDILINDTGAVIFKPRVGCWACMLSAKYGYLKWLKTFKPKMYRHLMVGRGLLKRLYAKKMGVELTTDANGKVQLESVEDLDVDALMDFLEVRPCFFDETLKEVS